MRDVWPLSCSQLISAVRCYDLIQTKNTPQMRVIPTTAFVCADLLFATALFGQATPSVLASKETFHIHGTVADPDGGVMPEVRVKFASETAAKAVAANRSGVYETDLPWANTEWSSSRWIPALVVTTWISASQPPRLSC